MSQFPLGVGVFGTEPADELLALTREAEDLGYRYVWLGDSQAIWREAYTLLGAAAVQTSRIALGTGVTNPLTRHWGVLASAFATLNELSGGRAIMGIGAGDSAVATIGQKEASAAQVEAAVVAIRALYSGAEAVCGDSKVRLPWTRAGESLKVYVAAAGPRMLAMAGRLADGAIIPARLFDGYWEYMKDHLTRGARDAGRDLRADSFDWVLFIPVSIHDNGDLARQAVRGHAARALKHHEPFKLSAAEQAVVTELYRHYDYYGHMSADAAHASLVPDWLLGRFAIAGTPAECREQLAKIVEAGGRYFTQICIIPYAAGTMRRRDIIRTFAQEVARA